VVPARTRPAVTPRAAVLQDHSIAGADSRGAAQAGQASDAAARDADAGIDAAARTPFPQQSVQPLQVRLPGRWCWPASREGGPLGRLSCRAPCMLLRRRASAREWPGGGSWRQRWQPAGVCAAARWRLPPRQQRRLAWLGSGAAWGQGASGRAWADGTRAPEALRAVRSRRRAGGTAVTGARAPAPRGGAGLTGRG